MKTLKLFLAAASLALCTFEGKAQTPLIDTNTVWSYLNDGTDQGTAWIGNIFDDSAWPTGQGKFGFGDPGMRTTIGMQANGYITFYFRHKFNVASPGPLVARYVRDDGLVVYLNEQEVFRSNMPPPPTPIAFDTEASTTVGAPAETQFFTNIIGANFVTAGENVLAVEVHQDHGTSFSSDLSFYLELFGDFPPQAPTVSVSEPDNTEVIEGASFPIYATASDVDGTITQVQFFLNAASAGTDTTAPYSALANSVAPGNYAITAVATDSQGLRATSAPVNITVVAPLPSLVPFRSTWRYLDDGSDQGTAWTGLAFIDAAWPTGQGELGYGDNDEVTVVGFGGDPNNKFITTYFRHTFNVVNPASISSLILRLVRDDGAAVYLNGTEIFRDNLPAGPLTYLTQATNAVEDAPILIAPVNPGLLVAGPNVIAVEIHQNTNTSSDISFDLNLIHNAAVVAPNIVLTAPPNGTNILSPATFDISARAWDLNGAVSNVQFFVDGILIGTPDTTVSYGRTATGIGIGQHTVSATVTDNQGQTATASVTVNVLPGTESVILVNTNQIWRYLDDGSDQGTAWRPLAFNDSAWLPGQAELGFGDGDEVTVIRSNRVDLTKITTFYFRRIFDVPNPSSYTNVVIRLRRDDGAVVYINDTEVFRSNMTNDIGVPILYTDFAGSATGSETAFNVTNASPSVLVPGQNIVAVEVHQQDPGSSDVSFEFQLLGQRPSGPALRIVRSGTTTTLSWFPAGGGYILQQANSVLGPWTTSTSQSNPQTLTTTGAPRFFRLSRP